MRPGLVVQHTKTQNRNTGLVRSDIAGIIGFVEKADWPEDAVAGDFVELYLRRKHDFWSHPDRHLFDPATQNAVQAFFDNGGDVAHVFGVCLKVIRRHEGELWTLQKCTSSNPLLRGRI